jgi:hypothetical protein
MRRFWKLLVVCVPLSFVMPAGASESSGRLILAQSRGGLCQNWVRECSRLWGYQTDRWHQCMGQPGARQDCGRGGYGYQEDSGGGTDLCRNWRRQCADLYGWRTRRWHQCIHQPQAEADCGF